MNKETKILLCWSNTSWNKD